MAAAAGRVRADAAELERFVSAVLAKVGCDEATCSDVTRAMLHGSRFGVDSHGVRLLDHYVSVLEGGRVARAPKLSLPVDLPALALLDAGDGHGARATYAAMDKAIAMARQVGAGTVAIRNSSHFGPAGAYALAAAEAGMIGFATCNSDAFVRLHDGAARFHGTNPLAWAAPTEDRPWFFDMATSAIPYNRVLLYRSTGERLVAETASDESGHDTQDPHAAEMLAPLGGAFGFKGAGLAGVAELLSAVLPGTPLSVDIQPMTGPDKATPRGLGALVMAIDPAAMGGDTPFPARMTRYLAALRASEPRAGATVMAPGDREWAVADERAETGIPLDPATVEAFARLSADYGIHPVQPRT